MSSVFNQSNWQVSGDVYNTGGDLILTKDSSSSDVWSVLDDLKREVTTLTELDEAQRQQILDDLNSAAAEARKPNPDKHGVVDQLNKAGDTLKAGNSVAKGALALAKTVASIAGWVLAFL